VAEFCTCGAELVPGARFCHLCGKPQRPEDLAGPVAGEEPSEEKPAAASEPVAPEIGFRNATALRVAMLTGALAFLATSLPLPSVIRLLLLMGAGFFAVYLYRRRSGQAVAVPAGIRMGWITGLFCFVLFTLLFTLSFSALALMTKDGGMSVYLRDHLAAMGMPEDSIKQAMEILASPWQMLGMLAWLFLTSTFLPALGGAIGSRLLERR